MRRGRGRSSDLGLASAGGDGPGPCGTSISAHYTVPGSPSSWRHTVAGFERAPLHSISAMLRRLNAFYESHGISPVGFRCPSLTACSADSPNFTTAKASFVGPAYEDGQLPRLLFLSLDSGSADPDPRQRTTRAVRRQNLATDVAALPKHKHWYPHPPTGTRTSPPVQGGSNGNRYAAPFRPRQQREVLPEQRPPAPG